MQTILGRFLAVVSLLLLAAGCSTKDLRSERLIELGPTAPAKNAAEARAILDAAADAHGLERWSELKTSEMNFRIDWDSVLADLIGAVIWDQEDLIRWGCWLEWTHPDWSCECPSWRRNERGIAPS